MSAANNNIFLLLLLLLLSASVSSQQVPSNCVIKREQEKCLEMMNDPENDPEFGCPWMWDNLTCWQPAQIGEVVEVNCPELFSQFMSEEDYELGKVSRNCTEFGWSETFPHYIDACLYEEGNGTHPDPYFVSVKALYTVGYSTSLVSLTTAMVILCRFRKLHCTRNFIHMNLFVSFILRAISVFIKDGVLYATEDSEHCFIHTVSNIHHHQCVQVLLSRWSDMSVCVWVKLECRAVMIFFHYCVLSNYFWLFIEGLYLFTLLVETFFPEKRYFYWYIIIGWGTPTVCVTMWAVLRFHFDDVGYVGFVVAVLYCFLNGEYLPQGAIGDQEEMAQLDGEQVLCCGPEAPSSFAGEQRGERGDAAVHPQQEQLADPHVQPAGRDAGYLSAAATAGNAAETTAPTLVPMTSLNNPFLNPYPSPYTDDTMMETHLTSDPEQPLV
ncbi:hypothetical protein INR49_010427 [Caranx melampygus]|nr:hypothetical protein INR49_010427 [Caranx melampygus]